MIISRHKSLQLQEKDYNPRGISGIVIAIKANMVRARCSACKARALVTAILPRRMYKRSVCKHIAEGFSPSISGIFNTKMESEPYIYLAVLTTISTCLIPFSCPTLPFPDTTHSFYSNNAKDYPSLALRFAH